MVQNLVFKVPIVLYALLHSTIGNYSNAIEFFFKLGINQVIDLTFYEI